MPHLDGPGSRADDGTHTPVDSSDVNEYLRGVTGAEFSAKDFRTWSATVIAARELRAMEGEPTQKAVVEAVDLVAEELGNTRSVCRASYIHPDVISGYLDGSLQTYSNGTSGSRELSAEERFVLSFLRSRTRKAKRNAA